MKTNHKTLVLAVEVGCLTCRERVCPPSCKEYRNYEASLYSRRRHHISDRTPSRLVALRRVVI